MKKAQQSEHDAIAVVDFGGQYAHLIATKVRRQNVLAEILQPEDPASEFSKYKGIIFSGSPALSAFGEDSAYDKGIFDLDIPILGFCFGHQEIAKHYGGKVIHGKQEWGRANLELKREHPLFKGLELNQQVWMSHFDSVVEIGPDFEELGQTLLQGDSEPHRYAVIASDKHKRYGFQFHPEVDDTLHGDTMIKNFAIEICGCAPSWTMDRYVEKRLENIKEQVGDKTVFLLASGGVDSTVAARLFAEALPKEQLHFLHVDTGLMRKEESQTVMQSFGSMGLKDNLHFVDASKDFLNALQGLVEPEEKRKAIGDTFVQVFEREARKRGLQDELLGQGTIYPDTIETGGTKRADTIKTHHNRVPVIEEMIAQGKVIEPLADLYKVEVRELGEKLNVPSELVWRHPFPGPGLGVRLLCSNGSAYHADQLISEQSVLDAQINGSGLSGSILPIKSVGVKADLRSYEHPVILSGEIEWPQLENLSSKIFKEVKGINRCLWNLDLKPFENAKPLKACVTFERLELLREADHIVSEALLRHKLYDKIWQCPTVLVPLQINGSGEEFCIVRPIYSERGMTARPAELPAELLQEIRESILALPGISGLAYDLTTKPPGTIEWE